MVKETEYVTIHSPFHLKRDAKNEDEVIKQLDAISKFYDDINAQNVIIHPKDLPSQAILDRYNFLVSTENIRPKSKFTAKHLKKVLDKYPNIKLCLDVSHAFVWSRHETEELVNNFKDKISQIHFSSTYRTRDHQSLKKTTDNFLLSIEPIKKLSCPIVIEEDFRVRSLKIVKEEIKYIKEYLSR